MKILMICSGNTCRSPMAEGIALDIARKNNLEDIKIQSMGVSAYDGESPTQNAIEAMKEIDIDISQKKSRRIMLQDLSESDFFYVMTQSHKDILLDAMPELECKIKVIEIPDPYGHDLETYRHCRDRMCGYFEAELMKLRKE